MKKMKKGITILVTLLLVGFTSPPDDELDPGYVKAFGYGTIAVSIGGKPSFSSYNPAQFDYQNGIFYVKAGTERLDMRALLPKGQTYESMMNALFKEKSSLLTNKKKESIYWVAWSSHEYGDKRNYPEWKPGSPHPDYNDKLVWRESINYEPAKTWNSSAVYWDDEDTDFKSDISTWLRYAKPGNQLYVINTVGFTRDVKEAAYWDASQGRTVTPIEFVLSENNYAYCIIQIK